VPVSLALPVPPVRLALPAHPLALLVMVLVLEPAAA
jgi:hypothetical protein